MVDEIVPTDETLPEPSPGDEGQVPETTGEEPEGEGTTTPAEDNAGASRSKGAEKRIKQLTAKYRAEEAARKAAQQQNEELARRLEALEKRIGPIPRPKRNDYETEESYEDALFNWNDQRREVANPVVKPTTSATSLDVPVDPRAADKFKASLMSMGEEVYDEVMTDDWVCSELTSKLLIDSARGPELAVMIRRDPELAVRINELSPIQAARELAKLEAGLPAKTKSSAVRTTLAPPVTPVKAQGTVNVDPDKLSFEEYRRLRQQGQLG